MSKRKGIRKWIGLFLVIGLLFGVGLGLYLNDTTREAIAGLTSDQILFNVWNQTDNTLEIGKVKPDAVTPVVHVIDGQVKGSAGVVYGILVSGIGVTAGDKIEVENAVGAAGTALITIVADAANGTWAWYPAVGAIFSAGIYNEETKTGGTFTVTYLYE